MKKIHQTQSVSVNFKQGEEFRLKKKETCKPHWEMANGKHFRMTFWLWKLKWLYFTFRKHSFRILKSPFNETQFILYRSQFERVFL